MNTLTKDEFEAILLAHKDSPTLAYSVRMRGQHKAEDWKGTVGYVQEPLTIEDIRAIHERLAPVIAEWQRQVGRKSLTSIEGPAVETAAELHEHMAYLLSMLKGGMCCLREESRGARSCNIHPA